MVLRIGLAMALASACSAPDRASPPAVAPPAATHSASTPPARPPMTPVALAATVLPGWTNRSAADGWWSAAGVEQLFVSDVDLGARHDARSPEERATLVVAALRIANERLGGVVREASPGERAAGAASCIVATGADHAHSLSCSYVRGANRPTLGIEYTFYGELAEADFLLRARLLVGHVAVAAR
jgi:hypothetical protein